MTTPRPAYRMPFEGHRHSQTVMCWPHRSDAKMYGDHLDAMQEGYVAVAEAISCFEPVTMVAHPDHADSARKMLGNRATVVPIPIDDSWARDSGPTFVQAPDGQIAGVSWRFNAWGEKHEPWDNDDRLAGHLLDHLDIPVIESWLTMEGGGLATDGEGTLVVSETNVLNGNRNPGVNKRLAEAELKACLGIDKVIWLPGDPMDTETDGHIDGMVAFVKPGVVLFESNPDMTQPHARILAENRKVLEAETDAAGRKLKIIDLPEAVGAAGLDIAGDSDFADVMCRSYINFYLTNGGVVMPGYGIPADAVARDIVAKAYPDREVVQIDVRTIAPFGGAVHCITQNVPA
ncbi:MAG: agmatine deiminase family protein [Pseudomonadota bacterium]